MTTPRRSTRTGPARKMRQAPPAREPASKPEQLTGAAMQAPPRDSAPSDAPSNSTAANQPLHSAHEYPSDHQSPADLNDALDLPTSPEKLEDVEALLAHFEQIEAQFQAVREGLTHSHRLATLGTIATMIAHEYNNILTPVLSYCQMAQARPDDHALMAKAVEKSLQGAQRAARISSSLLGFAREADNQQVALLRQTIDEAVGCLARDPVKDGMTLQVDIPDVQVAMSPLNLQQVMLNLILNARKAMRRQGGTLFIQGRVEHQELHLEVRDTGPGIPPAILGRLFEPFVTQPTDADENDAMQHKGTGLGLCICRDLIHTAGGTITATSIPGQGATFHLILPVANELPSGK